MRDINVQQTANYDCHIITIRQALPDELYFPYIFCGTIFELQIFDDIVACNHLFDSEVQRDNFLAKFLNVEKINLDVTNDLQLKIECVLRKNKYCICRLDTAFLTYFEQYFGVWDKFGRILGHKVFVFDFDEHFFYAIDNPGLKRTQVYKITKPVLLQALHSSILARYDKDDFAYYYKIKHTTYNQTLITAVVSGYKNLLYELKTIPTFISHLIETAKNKFLQNQIEIGDPLDVSIGWLNNLVLLSGKMALCYQLLAESTPYLLQYNLLNECEQFINELILRFNRSVRHWEHVKLLSQQSMYYQQAPRECLLKSLNKLLYHEGDTVDMLTQKDL